MGLDQVIAKAPKPLLVGVILVASLAFFVVNDPLKDECDAQIALFEKNTSGILSSFKRNKKTHFAEITFLKDACTDGNTVGACEGYLNALRKISVELKQFSDKCQIKYNEQNAEFAQHLRNALRVMPLLAWGEKPPAGVAERRGWLTETNITTFCAIKNSYIAIAGNEVYLELRDKVYNMYPDAWPEKIPNDSRNPEDRPKAYKTATNPEGTLTKEQVYERSLFSVRCDMFM